MKPPASGMNQWAILWLAVTFAFLFLLRPEFAFRPSWGGVDDECYKEWLLRALGSGEPLCRSKSYLPGIAALWLPAGALAKLVFTYTGGSLRNLTSAAVGITSFFSWVLGLGLLAKILQRRGSRHWAFEGILFTSAVPVLYYATSRTTLAHAGEFLMGALVLWALAAKRIGLAAGFATWMTLTRLNDAPVFLLILGTLADRGDLGRLGQRLRRPWWAALAVTVALAAGIFLFDLTFVGGYNKVPFIWHILRFRFERIPEVLWGSDWGLVWTAPFWLLCLGYGVVQWRRLSWTCRGAITWMGLGLVLCCLWPGNGSDFGYRYLIGSYAAAFCIWCETPLFRQMGVRVVMAGNGIWLTLLTIVYQTDQHLRPQPHWAGWITPNFQWEALAAVRDTTTYEVALSQSAIATTLRSLGSTYLLVPNFMRWESPLSPAIRVATTTFTLVIVLIGVWFLLQMRPGKRRG